MKEKYVKLSDLVPYEKNPRKNAKAVGPTARSMEDYRYVACEQLGRKCLMMELDPRYADVIVDRWEEFTGRKNAQEGCIVREWEPYHA